MSCEDYCPEIHNHPLNEHPTKDLEIPKLTEEKMKEMWDKYNKEVV